MHIDVEGAEYEAISGLGDMRIQLRPRLSAFGPKQTKIDF
jgi:hypothetical protein